MPKIIIFYSSTLACVAERVRAALVGDCISIWMYNPENPCSDPVPEITSEITTSDMALVLREQGLHSSEWVAAEIQCAVEAGVPVVFVDVEYPNMSRSLIYRTYASKCVRSLLGVIMNGTASAIFMCGRLIVAGVMPLLPFGVPAFLPNHPMLATLIMMALGLCLLTLGAITWTVDFDRPYLKSTHEYDEAMELLGRVRPFSQLREYTNSPVVTAANVTLEKDFDSMENDWPFWVGFVWILAGGGALGSAIYRLLDCS